MKTNFPIEFFNFFSYWRWGRLPHLSKTEVLAVVSKMAIFTQIVIFDIGEIFEYRKWQFRLEQLMANFSGCELA